MQINELIEKYERQLVRLQKRYDRVNLPPLEEVGA